MIRNNLKVLRLFLEIASRLFLRITSKYNLKNLRLFNGGGYFLGITSEVVLNFS